MEELLTKENIDYQERAREVAEKFAPVACSRIRPGPGVRLGNPRGLQDRRADPDRGSPRSTAGTVPASSTCASSSRSSRACGGVGVGYAVNALGSFPIILGGTEEQKRVAAPASPAAKLIAFGLTEKDAGLRRRAAQDHGVADGDDYVINGHKKWNTNGGVAGLYTIFAVPSPSRGTRGISPPSSSRRTRPASRSARSRTRWASAARRSTSSHFDDCRVPRRQPARRPEGGGFMNAMMTLDRARPGVAAQAGRPRPGCPRPGPATTPASASSSVSRSRPSRGSSSCWPTWPPRSRRRASWSTPPPGRRLPAPRTSPDVRHGQGLRLRHGHEGHHRRGADLRRLRLLQGLPDREIHARRQDHPDLRGHEPDPAAW